MGERPPGTTLDRRDNSLGYSPDNCRWATPKEQAANSSIPHRLLWNGKERSIRDIAHMEGVPRTSLNKRFARLGDIRAAMTETKAKLRNFR